MAKVTTSVIIDEEKRTLAKKMGINMSQMLNQALNFAINFETTEDGNKLKMEDLIQKRSELVKKTIKTNSEINAINVKIVALEKKLNAETKKRDHEIERMADSMIKQGVLHQIGE